MKSFFVVIITFLVCYEVKAQNFEEILQQNKCSIYARINQYDSERYNLLLNRKRVKINQYNPIFEFQSSKWMIVKRVRKSEQSKCFEVEIKFKCLKGTLENASVSIDFDFSNWSKENYVLLPSAVYNGNRYEAVQMDYSPFFNNLSQMGINKPQIISDQPRLNFREGYSRIQERSGSMSLPSIGFHSPSSKRGSWIFFQQGNRLGDYGVDIEEYKGRSKATISITSPLVRELNKAQDMRMDIAPSNDICADFKPGDEVSIVFSIKMFHSSSVQSLYDEFSEIKSEYYKNEKSPNIIPFSSAFKVIEKHMNAEYWNNEGYYANHSKTDWQPSWVGGLNTTFAFFAEGSDSTIQRSITTLDWLYRKGIAPSGAYFDMKRNGEFTSSKATKPFGKDLTLVRKQSEAIYYSFKQFNLMKMQGTSISPEWVKGNEGALKVLLSIWEKHKLTGMWLNQETGELIVGNSSSGGILPAALCEAFLFTENSNYIQTANEIAEYFYQNYVTKGISYGGPGDALQSFDSESSYGLLESFMRLYEITVDKKWLKYSEEMANQFSTWVVSYNYEFPENSEMRKLKMKTAGTVYANTQNKHTSAGICTHSGISLLKLYRATQNPKYLNLLCDIAHTIPQYMSFGGHKIPGYKDGWISERINMTDWQASIPIGGLMAASNWNETAMLLTAVELPGIYVNKDTRDVFVIDHINAFLKQNGLLEITNNTDFDAEVKVFAENTELMDKILVQNAFLFFKKVKVPAGKTIQFKI